MSDYRWSACFITAVLTALLGLALLIGAALYLPYAAGDATYELALGAVLCLLAPLLALQPRAGLAAYTAVFAAALIWALLQVGLDIWLLLPRLAVPLLWGALLWTLRHRIAPTHDPNGMPRQRLRRVWPSAARAIRGYPS
ncbi:MAG TPA: hypothetical protein VMF64_10485 [Steroidobacteraceae bacterium]|nr:hypothetical protein [Steroidobacteraceae bacterium]